METSMFIKPQLRRAAGIGIHKGSYWRAQYYHLTRRMHAKKAIVVIARKLLRIIYKIIKGTLEYKEYGGQYFADRLAKRKAS
ncbi:MAG: hypothetical protein IPO83_14070 [Chitinophagaceae bacterium]|nr:hypothetical protein [Chitinophagaceae bacterium]